MLGKTSLFLALYVLAVVITMTSTDARSHNLRRHLRGEDRPRGRHRSSSSNNNNKDERQGFGTHPNPKFNHNSNNNNNKDNHTKSIYNVDFGDEEDEDSDYYYYDDQDEQRTVDGITVPSLHAMQTFGFKTRSSSSSFASHAKPSSAVPSSAASSSSSSPKRKPRRPIRGSRKAVVVTKKKYLKKEWCKTQPLKQVVRIRGCLRTKILNNLCYGQCNSFFIPKKARRDKDAEAFMSCGFCRPRRFRWILVTLRCPSPRGLRFKRKRVQYIKKCRCMAQDVSMTSLA